MANLSNADLAAYQTWAAANISPASDPRADSMCLAAWSYAMKEGIEAGCERVAVYLEANAGDITTALDLPAGARALKDV